MNDTELRQIGQGIRLVVCDLDGTLLDSRKSISPRNLAAIKGCRKRGIFVTVCSGRVHPMLEAYSREIGIDGELIASNGAVIYDTVTGKMPWSRFADPDAACLLLDYCKNRHLDCIIMTDKGGWYWPTSKRIARFVQYNEMAAKKGLSTIPFSLFPSIKQGAYSIEGNIYKLLVAGLSPAEMTETRTFIESLGTLGATSSEPGLLDVSAKGTDKGEGVRRLAALRGVPKEQICVFGDYWNDIPMMREAALPIAMANGDDAAKQAASVTTETNDNDGVALALEKYLLLEHS
jgi:Cof subfamily protein (haloacid dehalogenase superfamily)